MIGGCAYNGARKFLFLAILASVSTFAFRMRDVDENALVPFYFKKELRVNWMISYEHSKLTGEQTEKSKEKEMNHSIQSENCSEYRYSPL